MSKREQGAGWSALVVAAALSASQWLGDWFGARVVSALPSWVIGSLALLAFAVWVWTFARKESVRRVLYPLKEKGPRLGGFIAAGVFAMIGYAIWHVTVTMPEEADIPHLNYKFTDSPALTDKKKREIDKDLHRAHQLLVALRIPNTPPPPTISVTTKGNETGGSRTGHGRSPFSEEMSVNQAQLGDRQQITTEYFAYALMRVMNDPSNVEDDPRYDSKSPAFDPNVSNEILFRFLAGITLSKYFNAVLWDWKYQAVNAPLGALLQIKNECGEKFANALVAATVQAFVNDPSRDFSDPDYAVYLAARLKTADRWIDSEMSQWPTIERILFQTEMIKPQAVKPAPQSPVETSISKPPASEPPATEKSDASVETRRAPSAAPSRPKATEPSPPKVSIGADSVVSINQSGGITAGTVNVTRPTWGLSDDELTFLTEQMRVPPAPARNALFDCLMNDPDSCRFATTLDEAFRAAGWNQGGSGLSSSTYGPQVPRGVIITGKSLDGDWLRRFTSVLVGAGITPTLMTDPSLPDGELRVLVGAKPRQPGD